MDEHGVKVADFTFYLWKPEHTDNMGVGIESADKKYSISMVLNDPNCPPISLCLWEGDKQVAAIAYLDFKTIYQTFLDKALELTKLQAERN